jgi:GNAT superfamily N-acetyltransferase
MRGWMQLDLLSPDRRDGAVDGLAALLVDCVRGGASLGFPASLTHDDAARWWRASLHADGTLTWVARDASSIVGTVQLQPVAFPNGRHRASVSKLLVHTACRGRGIASALMSALEQHAREIGRTLLVLDTHTGSPAEDIYLRWGWQRVGVIEDYALTPDGELAPTTIMSKRL